MVQSAEGQPVGHIIRTILTMPAHVCCLDPDRSAAERAVEPAHRALVCVRAQNLLGEPRSPWPPANPGGIQRPGGVQVSQVQIDRGADQVGQHRREVPVQQQPRRRGQRAVAGEQLLHFGLEPPDRFIVGMPAPPLRRVRADLSSLAVSQIPQLALQMHERHRRPASGRRRALDRRPELVDQAADRLLGLRVGGHAAACRGEQAEQLQQQQRLVRHPDIPHPRLPEPRQQAKQLIRGQPVHAPVA